jgi:hypothetical protein
MTTHAYRAKRAAWCRATRRATRASNLRNPQARGRWRKRCSVVGVHVWVITARRGGRHNTTVAVHSAGGLDAGRRG